MKALKYAMAAAVVLTVAGCDDENPQWGEGTVKFTPKFSAELTMESRADQALEESLILWVSNDKGVVRQYAGMANLPEKERLLAGSYLAEAWAGDSVSASWDKRWFKGQTRFDISGGATTDVEIKCKIANVAVRVEYAPDVDEVLQDYTLQVGHTRGTLTFDAEHLGQRAYFMMPSKDRDLAWTLTGTKKADGATVYTRTATIANAQPGHEYVFKISCAKGDEPEEVGGGFLNVVIVDNVIEKEDVVYVPISTDPIVINPVNQVDPAALTHNQATLTAKVEMPDAVGENPVGTFYYRAAESRADGWNEAAAEYVDGTFKAHVTGLTPGTTYEYYLEYTSELITEPKVTNTVTFATEPATQLPNSSFEDWQTTTPYLIYGEGQQMFWDSGNHGSKTMGKNVTVPDESIFHSGKRSIQLASQFVGVGSFGKLAAGNVFAGKYLKTDGTDGILGFGRPFTGRPTALRVWVKYKPVAITHDSDEAPEGFRKGAMDKGAIFVALWDSYTEEYNGEQFPIVIRTKASERHLFDPQSEHIVAYGGVDMDETEGDGLVELVIPIEYRRTDVRPSYIILTCSASKAGDFFTGGNGSNMWLDDMELLYE